MLSNYYVIHRVVSELRRLIGVQLRGAYSVRPGELLLVFEDDIVVTAILNPAHATLYAQEVANASAPRRNSISFFEAIRGCTVRDVRIAHEDKLVTFEFDQYSLQLRFYNSPNALLVRDSEVIAAFKKEPEQREVGKPPAAASAIQSLLPMLGKHLEAEFFVRNPAARNATIEQMRSAADAFDRLLRDSTDVAVYRNAEEYLLSPIVLHSFAERTQWKLERTQEDASSAVAEVLRSRRRTQTLTDRKKSINARLDTLESRTRKATGDARHGLETSARADRYRAIADAITIAAHELPKGSTEVRYEWEHAVSTAVLDPKCTPYENAAKFYDKARKSEQAKAALARRLAELERNTALIAHVRAELARIGELRALDAFEASLRERAFLLERSDESAERSGDTLDRFRRFHVAGGFEVLAGKNAKQNDELTMKIAAKEDLWFHARHVAGSHVVLRCAGRKEVPYAAIEAAASIAAFYSEAKTQKVAPVSYTKRKYVRKPKGAAPGAVVVEREEVVMAEPKQPAESAHDL